MLTRKDHFPIPFMDQMLDRLLGRSFYCFLDGYLGYNQIQIATKDQENTTFICPYDTFAFKRDAIGSLQCIHNFPTMYVGHFHRYG